MADRTRGDEEEAEKLRPMPVESSSSATSPSNKGRSFNPFLCTACFGLIFLTLLFGVFRPKALFRGSTETHEEDDQDAPFDSSPPEGDEVSVRARKDLLPAEKDLLLYYKGNDLSDAFAIGSDKALHYLASKMFLRRKQKRPFVMGAIGSGDLVGALGNCETESYTSIINRVVSKDFEAMGVKFELRVAVFGSFCGVSSLSTSSCLEASLGSDLDLIHYSFPRSPDDANVRERLGSIANGTVHIVELDCAGHAHSLSKGKNSKLLSMYKDFGADVLCLEDALQTVMGDSYAGKAWGRVGDGMHRKARDTESGLVWRNWMPGPLGHQFLADCTSMLLLRALRLSLSKKDVVSLPIPPRLEVTPICLAPHKPIFDSSQSIVVSDMAKWQLLPGVGAGEDDIPLSQRSDPKCAHPDQCSYYQAKGSGAGEISFEIPSDESLPKRAVFICCCCNADLCVEEQFTQGIVISWTKAVETTSSGGASRILGGPECMRIAVNMPFGNTLRIRINSTMANVPVRIAKIIVG